MLEKSRRGEKSSAGPSEESEEREGRGKAKGPTKPVRRDGARSWNAALQEEKNCRSRTERAPGPGREKAEKGLPKAGRSEGEQERGCTASKPPAGGKTLPNF